MTGPSDTAVKVPQSEQSSASVAQKLENSLPKIDINLVSDINSAGEHDTQPMNEELRRALTHAKPSRPRGRRRSDPPEPIALDHAYVNSPEKMNYALLLALLVRNQGTVTLTQADLERADMELSILFALSLDGTKLEVSVVSNESGIIRSPEAKWATDQTQIPPYAAPPLPPAAEDDKQAQAILASLHHPPAAPQAGSARVVPMRPPQETRSTITPPVVESADAGTRKPPEYVFPFETGPSPQTATPMSLASLQTELTRDQITAHEESMAVARVEGQGA